MREPLYRGRRVDNGELVEGYFAQPQGQRSDCADIYAWEEREFSNRDELVRHVVNVDTVGEYTGLKDKNGAKVFEGDVVVGKFNQEEIIGHIVYGSDACYYISRKGIFGIGLNNAEDWLKVIGNVHDNPELLEEKK